jgi:serine/threonine protein phosphatase PrpC
MIGASFFYTYILCLGDPDIITHKITQDDEFFVLACDGIWDCMTNQEVVDFVREGVIKDKSLETICEEMMDHCLADSSNSSGLGYDNMSVMVIGILNGKTEKEWYESIKHGRSSTITAPTTNTTTVTNDNSTTATPVITSNSTNTPVAQKETTATTTTTTTTTKE